MYYSDYQPLLTTDEYGYDFEPEPKRRSKKVFLFGIILTLAIAAYYYLFLTESGAELIQGSESATTDSANSTSFYSTRTEALTRLQNAVGTATNTKLTSYVITNGSLAGYGYGWYGFRSSSALTDSAATRKLIRYYTNECDKEDLVPGDLLIDEDEDFTVVFAGWSSSEKSAYSMYYVSPSDGKVLYVTFDYPYASDASGNLYREPEPRCLKSWAYSEETNDDDGDDNDDDDDDDSSTNVNNGPCSLTDTTCWNNQVTSHNWNSNSLVDHFDLDEFTKVNSSAISSTNNKKVLLQFAYELDTLWYFWNNSINAGQSFDSYWFASSGWGGHNGSSTSGITVTGFDPTNKTVTIKPNSGRFSYFVETVIEFWKGDVTITTSSGVKLTLGSGFQPPDISVEPKSTYTYSKSYGSVSSYFTCPMNHYGCWKKANATIDWSSTSSKLSKSFSISEFTSKCISHTTLKNSETIQMRLVRFVSQLQKAKNEICNVHSCSVSILDCNLTGTSSFWISSSANTKPARALYAETTRRHLPRVEVYDFNSPKVYLPDVAPEYGFRSYSTTYSSSTGLKPRFSWTELTNPIPSSDSRSTGVFGDYDHNNKSGNVHRGTDIADRVNGKNTSIVAAAEGDVLYAAWYGGYGKHIVIQHEINGYPMVSFYAHLNKMSVSKGDHVTKGQKIGYMGGSGTSINSYAAHLHFELCFGEGSSSSSTGRTSFTIGNQCLNPYDLVSIAQHSQ